MAVLPDGLAQGKVQQFWLPTYKFIEASKQIVELGEGFLGSWRNTGYRWKRIENTPRPNWKG